MTGYFMRKLTMVLLSLVLLIIILILTCLFLFNVPHVARNDNTLQRDIANMSDADAVRIALNDTSIKEQLMNHTYDNSSFDNNIYRIENLSSENYGNTSGYLNSSDDYRQILILITGTRSYMDTIRLLITVDMTEQKVAVIHPIHMIASAPEIHAIIPPRAYWYHPTNMGIESVSIEPENASAYVVAFSADEFARFKNGTPYNATVYDSGRPGWIWTTDAFSGNLSGVKIPYFYGAVVWANQSPYYLVVKNTGTNTDITVDAEA